MVHTFLLFKTEPVIYEFKKLIVVFLRQFVYSLKRFYEEYVLNFLSKTFHNLALFYNGDK